MDSWDNPIYPISDPDGQDQGPIFGGENVLEVEQLFCSFWTKKFFLIFSLFSKQ